MNDSAAEFDDEDLQHLEGRPCADSLFPSGRKEEGRCRGRGIDGATNTLARAAVKLDNYANGFAATSLARSRARCWHGQAKVGLTRAGRASTISPSGMPTSP